MAGNAQPIFAKIGKVGWGTLNSPNPGYDLTSNSALIFTSDSTNGSIVNEVRLKYLPGTSTVATAFRVWINNGSTGATATNNTLISEITVAAITTSQTAATTDYVVPMPRGGLVLPPSYRLYATIGTYSSGTFNVTAIGGDY